MAETPQLITFDSLRAVKNAAQALERLEADPKIGAILREKHRHGGYVCVTDHTAAVLLLSIIGEGDPGKLAGQRKLCMEKAGRLSMHPDHVLSRQSRKPEIEQYGGAVRGTRYLWSFSGLPEELDEFYMMMLAISCKDLSPETANRMLREHPNSYAQPNLDTSNAWFLD